MYPVCPLTRPSPPTTTPPPIFSPMYPICPLSPSLQDPSHQPHPNASPLPVCLSLMKPLPPHPAKDMMAEAPPMARCLYVYPLVQLLSQSSSVLAADIISSNQKVASGLLATISWNSEALCSVGGGEVEEEVELCPPCCPLYSMLETTAQIYRSCCTSSEQCVSRLRALIRGLKVMGATTPSSSPSSSVTSLDHLAILLCAVCWWRGNDLARAGAGLDDVLELFGCLANTDPTMVR